MRSNNCFLAKLQLGIFLPPAFHPTSWSSKPPNPTPRQLRLNPPDAPSGARPATRTGLFAWSLLSWFTIPVPISKRPSVETLCAEQSGALDSLMAELSLGIRNQRHFDDLEERADAIGKGLRDAFRRGLR